MYLCNHIILLLKFILYYFVTLLLISNIFAKIILILFILILFYLLYHYPRKRFNKLSELKAYKIQLIMRYAIKTKRDHIYNFIIISLTFLISFVFIFSLRLFNKNRNIDLIERYNVIISLIKKITLLENILNILLFILFLILYITIIIRLIKYLKYHIIKRHLYIIGGVLEIPDRDNWYELTFFHGFLYKIILHNIHFAITQKIVSLYIKYYDLQCKLPPKEYNLMSEEEKDVYNRQRPVHPYLFLQKYKKERLLWYLWTTWHYMILLLAILYDLYYNNYQLTHVFNILPWTFFYDLYIRISYFVDGLWLPHDEFIHTILYAKTIEIWDKNTLLIDGEFYDYNRIKLIYNTYMVKGFVKDTEHL